MTDQQRTEHFLRLFSAYEPRLFVYLCTLLANTSDAEEVFQETTLALWRSFDQFQPGTNFLHWAKRVAFNRVLSFRKLKKRQEVPCSEEFLYAIEQTQANDALILERRLRALADCLEKLSEADRQLVAIRYQSNRKVKELAAQIGRPVNTLYKHLERIRHALVACVERTLVREEEGRL